MFRKSLLQALLFLAISTPALSGEVYSGNETVEQEKRSIDAFLKAGTPNFHILNVRNLIDEHGQQKIGVQPSDWTIDFAGQHGDLPPLERDSPVVIFVHGYNTPLSLALSRATALHNTLVEIDDRLRAGKAAALRKSPMTFYAFLWRGESNFGTAQLAANSSAQSLAALIKQIADMTDEHKIVIIAHSLGTRLALESLSDLPIRESGPLVDSLVLVQGAVPTTDLLKWNAIYIWPEELPPVTCAGRYADSVRNARQLLYTFSAKDSVLYNWFSTKEWWAPIDAKCFLPVMDAALRLSILKGGTVRATALGSPFNLEAIEAFPKTPWERNWYRITDDPLFGDSLSYEHHSLKTELLQPLELGYVAKFAFRWAHSNYEAVNLDTLGGDFSAIADWHSPIFQPAGAPIIEALWLRVVAGFDRH